MTIELDRDPISYSVKVAMRRLIATWKGSGDDLADRLSVMVTEVMFDVAGTARERGAELGIMEGLKMIRTWED